MLHGYAIAVRFEFEADQLDDKNWVVDFGGLSILKAWLQEMFDHTLIVAKDDPMFFELTNLEVLGLAKVKIVDHVGCEQFAKLIYEFAERWMMSYYAARVRLTSVEVREHGANSAIYRRNNE